MGFIAPALALTAPAAAAGGGTTLTALGSAAVAGGTAAAAAGTAEEQRKSSSKAASKARKLAGTPGDPAATPDTGRDPLDALRRRKKASGRASTIQAGSLIPEDTGTKSLLG